MIGHEQEGLNAYAKFVGTMISGRSRPPANQKCEFPLSLADSHLG